MIEPTENIEYDDVFETIQEDAAKRNLSDDAVWKIWQRGLAVISCKSCHGRKKVQHGGKIKDCGNCGGVGLQLGKLLK